MFFLMIIGAVVGSFLIMLIPDYYAVGVYEVGGFDRYLYSLFGLAPALLMIVLQCGKYERETDLDEGGPKLLTGASCIIIALVTFFNEANGPLSCAISFYLNIFPALFFAYLILFDWIFREKLEYHESFLKKGPAIICGAPLLVIIALSYILAPEGTLLPSNIAIPISDFTVPLSVVAGALILVYLLLSRPTSSAYTRASSTQYSPSKRAGNFYYCSDSAMESHVRKTCRLYPYWHLNYVSNKTIYLTGNPDINFFWKCVFKATGNTHFVDDGWWVNIT